MPPHLETEMRGIKEYDPDTWEEHDPRDVSRKTTRRGELVEGDPLKDGCTKRKPSMNYHEIERDKTGGKGNF